MGSAFQSSTNQAQSGTSQTAPWAPQQQPVMNVIGSANDILNSQKGTSQYNGPLYANLNPTEQNGLQNLYGNGQNAIGTGGALTASGMAGVGGLGTATGAATDLANGNFQHADTTAGRTAASNVPYAMNGANYGLGSALGITNGNTTGSNVSAAGQYANNPYLNGQIDAASRDITRNLGENVLPGLNLAAAHGDNLNSSRAGAAEAIARRGASDQIGDISAQMRGQAYSQGLSLAEQARQANISGNLGAASAGNSMVNTGISGQTASNQANQTDLGIQAAGAGLLTGAANVGSGMATAGNNLGVSGAGQQLQAGQTWQADNQAQNQADYQKWAMNQQAPWTTLGNASNIIQGRNWGSTSDTTGNTTKTDNGNPVGGALALATAGGSLFGGTGTNGTGPSAASNIGGALSSAYNYVAPKVTNAASAIGGLFGYT